MIYLVLFCNVLIMNESVRVFGRQADLVTNQVIAWNTRPRGSKLAH